MNRVVWFIICTVAGLELIALGLLVPVHLWSLDARSLELAGANGPSLVEEGLALVKQEEIGSAKLLLSAAEQLDLPRKETLAAALTLAEQAKPKMRLWGAPALYLERIFERNPPTTNRASQAIIDILIPRGARETVWTTLRDSRKPGVLEIVKTRDLTNTVVFPPAKSASGQPLDATIALTALLLQQDQFAAPLRGAIESLVFNSTHGSPVEPLEMVYLDLLALGKRFNYGQLVELLRHIPDTNSLQQAAQVLRQPETSVPIVYSAIHLVESSQSVTRYLLGYPRTGLKDVTFALRSGVTPLRDLLERQRPVHYPSTRDKVIQFSFMRMAYNPLAALASHQPLLGLITKYGLYLVGVLLLARAITYLSPSLSDEIQEGHPFLTGPQVVIGLCLLFLVFFFTESMVTRATPAVEFPLRVKIPMASAALRATIPNQVTAFMDKFSQLTLLIFFLLQAMIYVSCRMKLAEIRRQSLPSRLKLRLLENEENLFDAGLYFGFVGTVLALILFSMGIHEFSLMAAYSSTSFGIIFVSILKIFHVRPYRRRLILDSETTERTVQPA